MNTIREYIASYLTELKSKAPLVHCITNYVTVNDVANALLAIGASPIMADDINETEEITAISSALVINIGTLNQRTIKSMIVSGKKANAIGIPVIFDPVGAGASKLRNDITMEILGQVKIAVLRSNLSEASFVAGLEASTKGVDSSEADEINDSIAVAKAVANDFDCVAAVTGATDIISDGERVVNVSTGCKTLAKVTGTGCMATALVGAFAGAGTDYFTAAVGGVTSMGIAGEIAFSKAGNTAMGSFHIAIIDALSNLNGEIITRMAKLYEE